jgi:hypothetical protein
MVETEASSTAKGSNTSEWFVINQTAITATTVFFFSLLFFIFSSATFRCEPWLPISPSSISERLWPFPAHILFQHF